MAEPMEKLGLYLQNLEQKEKVCLTAERNKSLRSGCEEIVASLLEAVSQKDPRFKLAFHGTGSYYDGVKVGEPDEFDYVAELTELSTAEAVSMVKTSDPGFVQIQIPALEVRAKWRDCLMLPEHLRAANARSMYHPLSGEYKEQESEVDLSITDISNQRCILSPFKVQRLFKKYVDEAMPLMTLPDHWVHSGYKKPNYSGCRRHGPATMLQFAHITDTEELKINIDVTLAIAVPLPTDASKLNLYVLDNVKHHSFLGDKLRDIFINGPGLHVIPLYSNVLIKTNRYQNKYAWRISCSLVEKTILDLFPDDGPKLCLRILKAIRDKFLLERSIKTRRQRRKRKKRKKQSTEMSKSQDQASSQSSVTGINAAEYTGRMKQTQIEWISIKQNYMRLNREHNSQTPEETVGPTTITTTPVKNTFTHSYEGKAYEDISDATDLEDQSKEEAFQEFKRTRMKFQREDISEMVAVPGSGEYYGPKTYMSSIEIKTYVLRLIGKHAESEFWTMQNIVRHVNDFLRSYHTILLERKMMKNFFFDSMVCAPISEEQRLKALEKFNVLFHEFNIAMEGTS